MKIDKVKTFTFKFDDDGGFYLVINGKRCSGDLKMPLDEFRKVARSLCRISLETYAHIDTILNDKKEEK